jgi:hypothetical protein
MQPCAGPPLVVAGEGNRVTRAARGVQVSLLSLRADGGTHMCGPAQALRRGSLPRGAKQTVLVFTYREAEANQRKPQLTAPTGSASRARR